MSKADISVEAPVPSVENKNSGGAQQGAIVSYGFLGGYRLSFNKHSGVEPSNGHTQSIQMYSLDSGPIGVKKNSDGALAAHVLRFPAMRWSPFMLAGVGGLILDPKTVAGDGTQTRLGHTNGDGADFNLKRRIFPRTEHRGVFYNSTTFDIGGPNSLDWLTNRVKPAVVFGYNF